MVGLALQLGLTLENYVVTHDAQRRTKEYELLTQIGQAISSRLDQDEILRDHPERTGTNFRYQRFLYRVSGRRRDPLRAGSGERAGVAKRRARSRNAFTEYVIRTGEPLLIRSELEKRAIVWASPTFRASGEVPDRRSHLCWANKAAGVMVAMNHGTRICV